ncbi:MAG: patatin-like phospholipase family protein, partial [Alphaproteobacteria bacterium]|nr:patatin-like phospholipase family protein [Alphaproteobacteria bacterium]
MTCRRALRRAAALAAAALLAGCTTMPRPLLAPEAVAALAGRAADWRQDAAAIAQVPDAADGAAHEVLVLSGGGPDGAFGIGLLSGLAERGRLPVYQVVTGVSTGALMAPLLFADPQGLSHLRQLYTSPNVAALPGRLSILRLMRRPGLIKSSRLRAAIDTAVDEPLLAAVAAQHRSGRRLLIATVNLDAQRLVVWDMGAIAASGAPDALATFRRVMLAAISIPVAMDPVLLAPRAEPGVPAESHVDASLIAPLFFSPRLLPERGCGTVRRCGVTVIVHNKLVPEPRVVPWSVGSVASRSLETLVKSAMAGSLREAAAAASARG